jgi:protein phosphatase
MKGKNNEDRFGVSAFRDKAAANTPVLLGVLSDGIGGNRAGEVASEMAVNLISQYAASSDGRDPQAILEGAIHYASGHIYHQAISNPEQHGMGATCACVWIAGDRVYTATVGDSRVYLLRGNAVRQLSIDHTWIQEALETGLIQPSETNNHPNAHVIRRYLGSPTPPEVDFRIRSGPGDGPPTEGALGADAPAGEVFPAEQGFRLLPSDCILLCSDGLTDLVEDEEILAAFRKESLEEAGHRLVNLANERGGHDNITLIAIHLPDPRTQAVPAEAAAPASAMRGTRRLLTGCLGVIALAVVVGALTGGYLLFSDRALPQATPTPTRSMTATRTRAPLPTRTSAVTPSPLRATRSVTPGLTASPVLPGEAGATLTVWPTNTPGLPIVSSTP